ncbi:helix-turn-helix domain-containing protein [Fredinandcohnia sp. 179-A 10B2 NHS]|uniref:helix-turn-helix domain-containing protein n=1 Tax=Fredinandcohnia sp. 179-A 10B2 NHS TaxID=3235176 RepID=UPI0039A31C94
MSTVEVVGHRIRRLRNEKKWSQQKLAEEAGISETYMGEIERAEKSASLDVLVRIANALNIPTSHLLSKAEELSAIENSEALTTIIDLLKDRPIAVHEDILKHTLIQLGAIDRVTGNRK